jgi:predicted ester cyclase
MSTEDNKAIVRRFCDEAMNKKNLVAIDEFVDPNVIDHPGLPCGIEGVKQLFSMTLTAFPDLHLTLEDEIAVRDKVVSCLTWRGSQQGKFMGIPPTSKHVTITSIDIARLANGKVVEHWNVVDNLGRMQQLGVIPTQG